MDQLNPNTIYLFWIYSTNEKGNSTMSCSPLIGNTFQEVVPENQSGNIGAIAGGVLGVLVAVIIIVVIFGIIIYRRRTQSQKKKHLESQNDEQVNNAYEDLNDRVVMSEVSTYQAIRNTDHKNQNESRGVDTYESLGSTTAAENQNTYQSLEKTESHGSEGMPMKLYENTKLTS